jgi:PAP_fibrillin
MYAILLYILTTRNEKMKTLSIFSLGFASLFAGSSFAQSAETGAETSSCLVDKVCDNKEIVGEMAKLVSKIETIAQSNTLNSPEKLASTRKKLEPLIEKLLAFNGTQYIDEQLSLSVGTWKELWSDDREPSRPGIELQRNTVFQVVTGSGYFYNVATSAGKLPNGAPVEYTSFLRGAYTRNAEQNGIDFSFTKIGFLPGSLPSDINLFDTIIRAETESSFLSKFPGDLKAPRGPIGAKGFLTTVFVNDNLRISRGFNKADGKQDLYILKRMN